LTQLQEYLDKLKPNVIVRGPLFAEPVEVIMTSRLGDSLKLIGTGTQSHQTHQAILSLDQLASLEFSPDSEPFDGDAGRFQLGIEAMRLALAYEYDPYFSLSIARIDPLPHQLEAVYDYFMKLPRIRFLLADDPGAGKTIMAGLLLKELKVRGLVKRILIVTPANLTFQWQREMKDKFRENFEIVRGEVLRANYGSNPWQEKHQVITSVSWVSRVEDAKESLLRSRWDLIFVDEAHKMSAYSPDKKTLTYKLGEELSEMTDHFVLATATPHKGDPQNFSLFLSLLDKDAYADVKSLEEAMARREAPFYLRRVKEALVTFPDPESGEVKTLFTKRQVKTIDFHLSPDEQDFYFALTDYVEEQSIKASADDSARGRALGFTMAMLQRRFASSIYAVRRSLERMREKREQILEDPEGYRRRQLIKQVPDDFDDLTEEEQDQILADLEEVVASVDPAALGAEIIKLGRLIDQAMQLEAQEVESKLLKLKEVITGQGLFSDQKMKLLVFTEHKDTLYYLAGDGKGGRPLGKLREWGLAVSQIHGGMKIGDRDTPGSRIYAEREFREDCQVMVATEAAGEGINLQFCWLTINYDIPWNPMRLEQRMGRTHRYGQEKDCLIFNFVSSNTREGRVLQKLFERIAQIEQDLDPRQTGKVFNVLGDVFPANQLEKMVREMYAHNLTETVIKNRIVEQVDTDRFRQITHSALEGLAKRELNLAAIVGKSAEARERRLVPEVIEDFFVRAGPLAGIQLRKTNDERGMTNDESKKNSSFIIHHSSFYHLGRVPRSLWPIGERLEAQFGRLGREYKQIVFDKKLLSDDPTLEWVTPGHPLFETVREAVQEQTHQDLKRGAVFYDLHREAPASLTIFSATIKDGRGRTLEKRLFVVEIAQDGTMAVRQPTLFLELMPVPAHVPPPAETTIEAGRDQLEHFLIKEALQPLLQAVTQQRAKEADTVARHVEISLNALIDRVQVQFARLLDQKVSGSTESGLEGRLKQTEDRLEELNERLERRRRELQQERQCTVADIQLHGRAWVLPHPERDTPGLAPMVRDDEIERIAVEAVIAYEQARGWQVESVEQENKGFDLISRRFHPEDPQTATGVRFIEVKGRAGVGEVALSNHEYKTALRLKEEYWLYAVFNCATEPEVLPISYAARLGWQPMGQVAHFRIGPEAIRAEAERQRQTQSSLVKQAFREIWETELDDWGEFNILVEGLSDKVYLELTAQRYKEAHGVDLLEDGQVRIIAGRGTKRHAPYFGMLQSLESQGIKFVVLLDGDEPGEVAAEAMRKFGAQKNRHYFHLERPDYKDKGGKSWPVEIEDMLAWPLLDTFIRHHPEAVEERFQRGTVQKVVIQGKPVERDGQTIDYKMMLTEYVRQQATVDDLAMLVELLQKARKCMGLRG
jgi:superfamily II DNA or RNA helicase